MGAGLEEQRRRIESIYNGLSKIAKEELELIQAGGFSLNHIQNRIASFEMTITNYNLMAYLRQPSSFLGQLAVSKVGTKHRAVWVSLSDLQRLTVLIL